MALALEPQSAFSLVLSYIVLDIGWPSQSLLGIPAVRLEYVFLLDNGCASVYRLDC